MHCTYCGEFIEKEDITRRQKLGFSTAEGIDGLVEVENFVALATCPCGTITQYEAAATEDHVKEVCFDEHSHD